MKVLFLGGDVRQKHACEFLIKQNIDAEFYSKIDLDDAFKDILRAADIIALPIPLLKDEIHLNTMDNNSIMIYDIISIINNKSIIFGGKFSNDLKEYLNTKGISYVDYMDIESFQIQNALLSAEGAIYYAKQYLDRSIYGAKIAVLGFGRIGKILSYLLHSQGAKITVCARKDSDCTWSKLIGFNGFKIKITGNISNLNLINNKYDIIFNTIPYWIMNEEFAQKNNSDSLIIDIASRPFGIDPMLVKKYNLNYHLELGIPGRYAPQSAGEIIAKTILNNTHIKED